MILQKACEILRTRPSYAELEKAEAIFSRLENYKDCAALKEETENVKEAVLHYERVTMEIQRYQERIREIERKLPSMPLTKRAELKRSIKWYRGEIEKLQGK